MDEQKFKAKQMALDIFERLLKQKDYASDQQLLLECVKMARDARQSSKPKMLVMACDELVKIAKSLTTSEIQELTQLIRSMK